MSFFSYTALYGVSAVNSEHVHFSSLYFVTIYLRRKLVEFGMYYTLSQLEMAVKIKKHG